MAYRRVLLHGTALVHVVPLPLDPKQLDGARWTDVFPAGNCWGILRAKRQSTAGTVQ